MISDQVKLGRNAKALLKRVAAQDGRLLLIQVISSGGSGSKTLNDLRNAGLVKIVDHPTVQVGRGANAWPADALALTDAGIAAIKESE